MTSGDPSVDVVIPCWGTYSGTLERAIWSASRARHIIVVGDEAASDVAARTGSTFVAVQVEHAGPARQQGLGVCTAEFVCFLDADDSFTEYGLDTLIRVLRRVPDAVAVSALLRRMHSPGSWPPVWRARMACTRMLAPLLLFQNCLTTVGACLIRRDAVEGRVIFPHLDDEDWHAAIALRVSGPVVFLPVDVVEYATLSGSVSRQKRDPKGKQLSQDRLIHTALTRGSGRMWWWRIVERFASVYRARRRSRAETSEDG